MRTARYVSAAIDRACCSSRPLGIVWAAMGIALACVACGGPTHADSRGLFAAMPGPRASSGALRVDEVAGRFGPLRFGMPLGSAKKAMPSVDAWGFLHQGEDLLYCGDKHGNDCDGAIVKVTGSCEATSCVEGGPGPVAEIEVVGTGDFVRVTGRNQVQTDRGIRLGAPASEVRRRYKIAQVGSGLCVFSDALPAVTYVALTGANTVAFAIHDTYVWAIALRAGRHPHLCPDRG